MVIFLFLRSVSATIIPSVAVPLSLVGTFGAMYLLGYSLNNLTLMALTISTGFVVDDAIVMIENIIALHRGGRKAARRRAEGRGADRLHDPVPDRLAHRGADPAPLHGRRRRPPLPRVRRDPFDHDPRLGGRLPDADAHDVREDPAAPEALGAEPVRRRPPRRSSTASIAFYERTLEMVLEHQPLTLAVAVATLVVTIAPLRRHPEGLLPRPGHRRDPGHLGGAAVGVLRRRWPSGSRRWPA